MGTRKVAIRYAELFCKSNFTFLEGASHPDELVATASQLGYDAIAITDRNSLAGIVRTHTAGRDRGIRTIVGAVIDLLDAPSVVLWPTDRASYGRLARLVTTGCRRGEKGECLLSFTDLPDYSAGLMAGLVPPVSAPTTGNAAAPNTCGKIPVDLVAQGRQFSDLFGDRGFLLAPIHSGPDDRTTLLRLQAYGHMIGLPLVAAGEVHYHEPQRQPLQDVLTAIRTGTTVAQASHVLLPNAQRHLRSLQQIQHIYRDCPDCVSRTVEVAERCRFSLSELRYEYPEELAPDGKRPCEYLQHLTWEGALQKYPQGLPEKIRKLIVHELQLIEELHYESYFLTVRDLVQFARSRGILCQGRGSAANSAVCFCLGITAVDPDRSDVLFERFVSRERDEAPDIDVDFEHERREEVLQYLYSKYGRERAGITAEVITYRLRSAVRDVGKALGLSLDRIDALAKNLEHYDDDPLFPKRCREVGIDPDSRVGLQLIELVRQLIGFPRHLSQHVGGMVITRGPLCELVPIENAAMPERTVIQWNKDDLDDLGILKVDCLALGMLTAIRKCMDLVRIAHRSELQLSTIPSEDPRVYDMICRADTMGVFQIESRAQMSMLPRLKPRCFYDLVIEVAIVRPGPIQGQMVHPYLRRRNGDEEVQYPTHEIREVLHKTMGVPIFQEQAMRLAVVAAGFTPGEADQLRRAMGAWRRPGVIDAFRKKLLDGMRDRNLSEQFAEQVFHQIRGFGEYGFPESHAASFALLVYVSAWLKCHYPDAFLAALLNSQPMGFYAPAQLVRDARQHGVEVRAVDINHSDWDCTLELVERADRPCDGQPGDAPRQAVRLGFRMIRGIVKRDIDRIVAQRQAMGPYDSQADLVRRTGLSRSSAQRLSRADVMQSLNQHRRQALWHALAHDASANQLPLFAGLTERDDEIPLPSLADREEVFADYESTGLSLRQHPIEFYRVPLTNYGVVRMADMQELRDGARLKLGGLVILRQRPSTAKGITFVTLEDETGVANLVLHTGVWQRFYRVAKTSPAWVAHGKLQRSGEVTHIVVDRIEDLSQVLAGLATSSRDFR